MNLWNTLIPRIDLVVPGPPERGATYPLPALDSPPIPLAAWVALGVGALVLVAVAWRWRRRRP